MYIRIAHLSFMKKVVLLFVLASLLQGCRSTPTASSRATTPIGRWSITSDDASTDHHGVELLQDGRARSINLLSLHFDSWLQRGDTLILSGRSVVEETETLFSDTMKILSITDSQMVLLLQNLKLELNKLKD
jgi:hypothetical protein